MASYEEQRESFKEEILKAIPGAILAQGFTPNKVFVHQGAVGTWVYFDPYYEGGVIWRGDTRKEPTRIDAVALDRVCAPPGYQEIRRQTIKAKDGVVSVDKVVAGILRRLEAEDKFVKIREKREAQQKTDAEMHKDIASHDKTGRVALSVAEGGVKMSLYLTPEEAVALIEAANGILKHQG